jgi:hypothetical protein
VIPTKSEAAETGPRRSDLSSLDKAAELAGKCDQASCLYCEQRQEDTTVDSSTCFILREELSDWVAIDPETDCRCEDGVTQRQSRPGISKT